MNSLLAAHALLGNAMLSDPRIALANAVAWLDPLRVLGMSYDDEDDYDPCETDYAIGVTLRICRQIFPDIYASASQLTLQGATQSQIEHHLCDSINVHLTMPIEDIMEIPHGIPIQPIGLALWEREFWEQHEEMIPFLAALNLTPENADDGHVLNHAAQVAAVLRRSLEDQPGNTYENLLRLLEWVFGSSGNTLVDMSPEEFYESGITLMDWTPDNIAFTNEMAEEAEAIITEAQSGLEYLTTDVQLYKTLRKNVRIATKALARIERSRNSDDDFKRCAKSLKWPDRP